MKNPRPEAKQIAIRLTKAHRDMANQSIISQAIRKNTKPETFSDYIRRLIVEDHNKAQEQIVSRIKE